MTKMFALGALGVGALGAGAFALHKRRQAARAQHQVDAFDYGDLDDPVVVTEEVIVITEPAPFTVDMELIPVEEVTTPDQRK